LSYKKKKIERGGVTAASLSKQRQSMNRNFQNTLGYDKNIKSLADKEHSVIQHKRI